ncbi:MAG: hypothetical protein AABW65_00460 [Nanoarchaeota archaeon]
MIQELEQCVNGEIIIDNSVFSPEELVSLPEALYEGRTVFGRFGFDYLYSCLENRTELLREIKLLIGARPVHILKETTIELKRYYNILNEQEKYIKGLAGCAIQEIANNGNGSKRARRHINNELSFLNKLKSHNQEIYSFHSDLLHRDPRDNFTRGESNLYKRFFNMVVNVSKDITRNTIEETMMNRHPVFIGEEMQTDKHLIACAFVIAQRAPVVLATHDNGIRVIVDRIYNSFADKTTKKYKLSVDDIPLNHVHVFFPSDSYTKSKNYSEIHNDYWIHQALMDD